MAVEPFDFAEHEVDVAHGFCESEGFDAFQGGVCNLSSPVKLAEVEVQVGDVGLGDGQLADHVASFADVAGALVGADGLDTAVEVSQAEPDQQQGRSEDLLFVEVLEHVDTDG